MDLMGALFIFGARLLDVPLGTFRILLLVRGKKLQAASTAFFESGIYLIALGYVLQQGVRGWLQIVAYAGGYAVGNFLGATLEEKILSGFVLVEAVGPVTDEMLETVDRLRDEGFGTTVVTGSGKTGERMILKIICRRHDIGHVAQVIGNRGFVFASDVRAVWGGYFRQKRK
ncbi:MAG: hypothetical protein BWY01_01809 [Synergistetes bacterium ADurb.Bin155]|jgi:uncharacterized protein YebE (UPF0316 family)|nr:hypothetical protein [Synergistales bacterium]MBP8996351.1 hypothetical protein [Synergistales bacterium]NMD17081.1 hypothetical protein [Synergistaceae bacterium]OQB44049.1 MAG: hypothetical protein BWY01_01809 [Synergistetes bacterium ADurb.Bin155]HQL03268.1 DUF5698 domain-containing protein [Synergistales bacterium]